MDLTPVSEISSTTEFEEEREMLGIEPNRASITPPHHKADIPSLQQTKEQLDRENKELRAMVGYLDEAYHKSRKLGREWQSFGRYTAEILKEEMASSESKDRVMREELTRLSHENKELKEMCILLDKSRDGNEESSLTPPESVELMLHGRVVQEMNQTQGSIPCYTGLTKGTTLNDSQAIRKGMMTEANKEMALTEMKKRLERVERERLELIKSLSAAHTLAAESTARHQESCEVQLPPNLQKELEGIRKSRNVGGSAPRQRHSRAREKSSVTSDVILSAATLLDVVRRLDATSAGGFADGVAEGEAVALRLLVSIAWQKLQENLKS